MDLSNIHPNQTFKNYKELCLALGQPIKSGRSKVFQLKEWERFFSYSQKGHSFVIKEVFAYPIAKPIKGLIGYKSKLLLNYLIFLTSEDEWMQPLQVKYLTKDEIYTQIGLTNETFTEDRRMLQKSSKGSNYLPYEFASFMEREHAKTVDGFINQVKKGYFVNIQAWREVYNLKSKTHRPATEEENIKLSEVERLVSMREHWVNQQGEVSMWGIFTLQRKGDEFYREVFSHESIKPLGINGCYRTWKFTYSRNIQDLAIALGRMLGDDVSAIVAIKEHISAKWMEHVKREEAKREYFDRIWMELAKEEGVDIGDIAAIEKFYRKNLPNLFPVGESIRLGTELKERYIDKIDEDI